MALPQGRARADTCNDGVFNAECEDNAIRLFTEGDSLFDALGSVFGFSGGSGRALVAATTER